MTATSMPWVKLYTETLDDAKLLPLGECTKWRFVQLILLAGDCDQGGWLANNMGPITIETISMRLRVTVEQLKKDLSALQAAGLMTLDAKSKAWQVTNFDKRQGRPQSQKRELWRDQKNRQRRVRADTVRSPTDVHTGNGSGVRLTEEEVEEDKDLDIEGEKSGADAPTPNQIKVYESNGGQYPTGKLIDGTSKKEHAKVYIIEHVSDTPGSLDLWGKVVFAYQAQWSGKSYTVMVNDYYLRNRIPGQATTNNPNGGKLSAVGQMLAYAEELKRGHD